VSQEHVDLYRKWFEAATRGDFDAVAAYFDPDILVRTDPGWPEQRIYGREAVTAWLRDALESMGRDYRIDEVVDLGDRVLARWCWKTRGQHSGIGGELRYSEITTYRERRAVLIEHFRDHAEALRAVGLEDQSKSANLDLVRSIYADWERGNYSATGWADPEMEYIIADGPDPVRGRGVKGMAAAWREVLSAWHDYRAFPRSTASLTISACLFSPRSLLGVVQATSRSAKCCREARA
jgi:ketosteroid isomerase-like protein